MQYNIFQNLPAQAMTPEVSRKLLAYQEGEGGYTVNLMQAKAGAQAPAHSHPHQQVVYIISGRGDFLCGQETQTLTPAMWCKLPPTFPTHLFPWQRTPFGWNFLPQPGKITARKFNAPKQK